MRGFTGMAWVVVGLSSGCGMVCPVGFSAHGDETSRGCVADDGVRHGTWTEFNATGVKVAQSTYVQGVLEGPATTFHVNGGTRMQGLYVMGRQEGPWLTFDEAGNQVEETNFRSGVRHGIHTRQHANHVTSEEGMFVKDRRNGLWLWHYPHGALQMRGFFYEDQRDGEWIFYTPDGRTREHGLYRDGEKSGEWTTWQDNGERASVETYDRGVLHGPATTFHPNGRPQAVGSYEHGLKAGVWTQLHPSGAEASAGTYVEGQEDGPWAFHDPAGRLTEEGSFERGQRRHLWKTYDDDGRVSLRLGALVTLPVQEPRNVMLGVPQPDGTVRVNLAELVEPGTVLWIHQSISQRIPAVVTQVRQGNAFSGADARLDDRAVGILTPDRPLVMDARGNAREVVVVTTENLGQSPLLQSWSMTPSPDLTPAVAQQVQALSDVAFNRTLQSMQPGLLGGDATTVFAALRKDVRKRGFHAVTRDVRTVEYRLDAERALLKVHVTWQHKGRPVLVHSLDMLLTGHKVDAWDASSDETRWLYRSDLGTGTAAISPPLYETLFDVDNDGRPEVLRQVTRAGVTQVSFHELQFHNPHLFQDPVLTDNYGF